jgi:hypothetical protein
MCSQQLATSDHQRLIFAAFAAQQVAARHDGMVCGCGYIRCAMFGCSSDEVQVSKYQHMARQRSRHCNVWAAGHLAQQCRHGLLCCADTCYPCRHVAQGLSHRTRWYDTSALPCPDHEYQEVDRGLELTKDECSVLPWLQHIGQLGPFEVDFVHCPSAATVAALQECERWY